MAAVIPPVPGVRKFTESHYFRRSDALPERDEKDESQVTFFKYCTARKHGDNGENLQAGGEMQISRISANGGYKPTIDDDFPQPLNPGATGEFINIAYFGTCDRDLANGFIKAVHEQVDVAQEDIIPAPSGLALADPPSLRNCSDFVTGLSILARFPNNTQKALTLVLALPYIGLRNAQHQGQNQPVRPEQSVSLSRYTHLGTGIDHDAGNRDSNIRVHQAWFTLFDDTRLAVFKSRDDPKALIHGPIHSYQPRTDAFQALPSLVSNIFTPSERAPLNLIRTTIKRLRCAIRPIRTTLRDKELSKDDRKDVEEDLRKKMEDLDFYLDSLCAFIEVVDEQIEILKNLMELWESQLSIGGGGCEWGGCVRLPFMKAGGEAPQNVAGATRRLVKERIEFRRELERWLGEFRTKENEGAQGTQIEVAQSSLKAICDQGQTVSVFTLITTVFLPLGFLSSYFGLNPAGWKGSITSNYDFWKHAAPITGVLFIAMASFLYLPDDWFKDQFRKMCAPFARFLPRGGLVKAAKKTRPQNPPTGQGPGIDPPGLP